MNKNDFNRFIGAGLVPGGADLEGARELTGLFPWFHSAHLVLLRGLRESSDIKFESQLKSSALYVADRSILYHYLFLNFPERVEAVNVRVPGAEQLVENTGPGPEPVVGIPEPEIEIPGPEPEIKIREPELPAETEVQVTGQEVMAEEPDEITDLQVPEPVIPEEALQEETGHEELIQEALHPEEFPQHVPEQEELPQEVPLREEPPQHVPEQAEPQTEESSAEDTSLKTRDELIAEIEARLVELKKEDLLELAETEEISIDPVSGVGPRDLSMKEENTVDSVAGESTEASNDETDELQSPEGVTGPVEPVKQLTPDDLIDRFIKTSPRIERMTPGEVPLLMDLTEHRNEEHTPFITETLAGIYVNQGYYTRAINIYEKLTLQFPEKSAYFASRIEKIKELIK